MNVLLTKDSDNAFKAFNGTKAHDFICYKNIKRGTRVHVNDTNFWALSREVDATKTVTLDGESQNWFKKEHTNDPGATS